MSLYTFAQDIKTIYDSVSNDSFFNLLNSSIVNQNLPSLGDLNQKDISALKMLAPSFKKNSDGNISSVVLDTHEALLGKITKLIDDYGTCLDALDSALPEFLSPDGYDLPDEAFEQAEYLMKLINRIYYLIFYILDSDESFFMDKGIQKILNKEPGYWGSTYLGFLSLAINTKSKDKVFIIGPVLKSKIEKLPANILTGNNSTYHNITGKNQYRSFKGSRRDYIRKKCFDLKKNIIEKIIASKKPAVICYQVALEVFDGARVSSECFKLIYRIGSSKDLKPDTHKPYYELIKIIFLNDNMNGFTTPDLSENALYKTYCSNTHPCKVLSNADEAKLLEAVFKQE